MPGGGVASGSSRSRVSVKVMKKKLGMCKNKRLRERIEDKCRRVATNSGRRCGMTPAESATKTGNHNPDQSRR